MMLRIAMQEFVCCVYIQKITTVPQGCIIFTNPIIYQQVLVLCVITAIVFWGLTLSQTLTVSFA